MRRVLRNAFVVAAIMLSALPALSDATGEEAASDPYGGPGPVHGRSLGIIFNTKSLLLDIESYQAGIGIKLREDRLAARFLGDLFYANEYDTLSIDGGVTVEYHLRPGRVSPYVGGLVGLGIQSQKYGQADGTWSANRRVAASFGGVLGVELFLLEYLSVFAEYAAVGQLSSAVFETSSGGRVERTTDYTFVFDTKAGNNGRLGLVIYLP